MDILHKILQWVDYNRWKVISLVVFCALLIGISSGTGCSSMTMGLIGEKKVDRPTFNQQIAQLDKDLAIRKIQLDSLVAEYNVEVEAVNAQIDSGYADLDEQDALRVELATIAGSVVTSAATGTLNPVSLIPTGLAALLAFLALGQSGDKRRADARIRALKSGGTTTAVIADDPA